jgi:hypothetical protein
MSKIAWITRPPGAADPASRTRHPTTGVLLALAGMMLVGIAAILSGSAIARIAAGGEATSNLTSAFALNTFGLGVTKIGIAVVLVGIVLALWRRVSVVSAALPRLRAAASPEGDTPTRLSASTLDTPFGTVKLTREPSPLLIHRMAERVWFPMLAMGAMVLAIGLFVGLRAAAADPGSQVFRSLDAWGQGTLYLGEGLLLSGIAFLLGPILSGLRRGGGEVQQSLGVPIQTLVMPRTATAFIALMMLGLMTAIVQFALYGVVAVNASSAGTYAVWLTWLGPLREVALGVLLASIVLALAAIARALGFQFHRIRQLATGGA